MTLNINFFFTSPVEVVRVTPKNLEEVAAWCTGKVARVESRKVKGRVDSYVWVPTPDGAKLSWAFPGMYITKRLAVTENNELKETYSVFRKDYFQKNYFEDPSIALEDTWGRFQKERDHAARQARTVTIELPEGADIEATKAEILDKYHVNTQNEIVPGDNEFVADQEVGHEPSAVEQRMDIRAAEVEAEVGDTNTPSDVDPSR